MLNKVVLIGRLTKDPELRYTPNGKATCSFTLACDRQFKNAQGEKETDFIPCDVPPYKDKLAELCANYLAKGKLASVAGRLQVRSFDGQDGQRRWVTEVIAEEVVFLSPKDENTGTHQGQGQGQGPNTVPNTVPPYAPPAQPSHARPYGQPPTQPPYSGPYGQPPAQGYPTNPPGYMAAPPSSFPTYPPQTPPGATPPTNYGHAVNMNDDDIPF